MNRDCFGACVTHQPAPALRPGQIVVADKLSSHRSTRVLDLLRAQGNDLIFLPPCSPDLNPIGMAFSKLKTVRRENDSPDRFLTLRTPKGRGQNLSSLVEKGRRSLRPVPGTGMPKLLRSSRIWAALKATRSSVQQTDETRSGDPSAGGLIPTFGTLYKIRSNQPSHKRSRPNVTVPTCDNLPRIMHPARIICRPRIGPCAFDQIVHVDFRTPPENGARFRVVKLVAVERRGEFEMLIPPRFP